MLSKAETICCSFPGMDPSFTLHVYYLLNPIPTGHRRNQPIYECQVTTVSRNRVKLMISKGGPSFTM